MAPIVETSCGRVEGEARGAHQRFLGIPFAAPPLGALRLCAPRSPAPWTGVRESIAYGLAAPQLPNPMPGMAVGEQGEDCLTLNVFTPATDSRRRPVLFWIHGGGFTGGSGGQSLYDGGPLCERGDLVVVTIQYRLGALGYLHLPGHDQNRGQLDQIAALRWTRENIAAFGGDPANVTIFGESAGGMAVATLLAMPAARGLFRRAIAQSGAAHMTHTAESAARVADTLLDQLGIRPGDGARLAEVPVGDLLAAQARAVAGLSREGRTLAFAPVVDPDTLPVHPLEAVRAGAARDVALITGTTRDEVKLFRMGAPPEPLDDAGLRKRVGAALRASGVDAERAGAIIETYRSARQGVASTEPLELFDAIDTDRIFRIPAIRLAEAQQAHRPDTYLYLFRWESPARRGSLGSCHALELPFVFGTLAAPTMDRFAGVGPDAEALSTTMMDAWIGFAREGAPTHAALPDWPGYTQPARPTLVFEAKSSVASDPQGLERAAWDGLL